MNKIGYYKHITQGIPANCCKYTVIKLLENVVYLFKRVFLKVEEKLVLLYKLPPLFRLKLVYSYVVEVADSEYQLLFHRKPL